MRRSATAALLIGLTAATSVIGHPTAQSSIRVIATPLQGEAGGVTGFGVREIFSATSTTDGARPVFAAEFDRIDFKKYAESIVGLTMRDAAGDVPVAIADDPAGAPNRARRWRASRDVRFPLTVRYRIATGDRNDVGPPYAVKQAGGGAAGGVRNIILKPVNIKASTASFEWDMAAAPKDWIGVAGAGPGRAVVTGGIDKLEGIWALVGPARTFASPAAPAFRGYLLGEPPFNASETFDWSAKVYRTLARRFGYLGEPPYALIVRALDGPAFATATAGEGGALYATGNPATPAKSVGRVRAILAHEMIHQWIGQNADQSAWFAEGLTVFFAATIPCQAKLLPTSECAADINDMARRYAISPARHWSNERIRNTPFMYAETHHIRIVPYARGMLFFAELDEQLRARSGGKRTLVDAIRPLLAARRAGSAITNDAWEAMLRRELGGQAVTAFRKTLVEGTRAPQPGSGAFGPCLKRRETSFAVEGSAQPVTGFTWEPVSGKTCSS